MADMANNVVAWSELVPDLLHQVKRRLPLPDLIRLSCVCASWRFVSSAEIRHKDGLPWLIVPYVVDSNSNSPPGKHHNYCRDGVLGLFSILDGHTYKLEIPELHERRVCGTSHGWLVTVHANSEMHLLHPFTRELLALPSLTTFSNVTCSGVYGEKNTVYCVGGSRGKNCFVGLHHSPEDMRDIYIKKVIPFSVSHPPVAVCITEFSDLYFSRHGEDPCWTRIDCDYNRYSDLAIYKGNLYALRNSGVVDLVTGLDGFSPLTVSLFASYAKVRGNNIDRYLLASSSELLLIVRFYSDWILGQETPYRLYDEYRTTESFRVFRLVLSEEDSEWELGSNVPKLREIKNLRDRALFVGFNESFSVVASEYPGCKSNSIYFSDDTKSRTCKGHDKGIFNLDVGTIENICPIDSKYVCPRPIWYSPDP